MTHICPVCESGSTEVFLQRQEVPVHQNILYDTREDAQSVVRGDLRFAFCEDCGFIFNEAFDPRKLSYGEHYDNRQDCSAYFRDYMDQLIHRILSVRGLNRHRVVEVGCGKGSFLKRLVELPGSACVGYGFDPSYVGPESDSDGRLRFARSFFGPGCEDIRAEAVICRHVIEHVSDPRELIGSVRQALDGAWVFFETPCVEWILRNRVIWDFFYEHCSLFGAASLRTLFEQAGFTVESMEHVFGGQYLWLEARLKRSAPTVSKGARSVPTLARRYAESETEIVRGWIKAIARLAGSGKVALWGAGAKGVTFANLVDRQCRLFDCVIDLNPRKQGRYLPGTGHPVVDYRDIPERGIRSVVLMNSIYRMENEKLLGDAGIQVKLVETNETNDKHR